VNLSPAPAAVVAVDVAVDVAVAIAAFIDQAITIWQLEIGILCSPMLNNWDVAQQFVGDIYSTWHIIAMVCGLALRKSLHIFHQSIF